MKNLVLICIALSALIACNRDTESVTEWPRPVEPRLTGASVWQPCRTTLAPDHVVAEAQCGQAPPADMPPAEDASCEDIINQARALRVLAEQPACIDAAIGALERFARANTSALSDLAAAYYVRAHGPPACPRRGRSRSQS